MMTEIMEAGESEFCETAGETLNMNIFLEQVRKAGLFRFEKAMGKQKDQKKEDPPGLHKERWIFTYKNF